MLAGGGVLVLAGAAAMTDPGRLRAHYFHEASRFLEAKNYQAALLGFERVAELDGASGADRRVEYDLAVCLDALGEHDRAETLIDRLAPDDRAGFAPAHAWKARRLLAGAEHSPAAIRDAESHLLHALQDAPNTIEAHDNLGAVLPGDGAARARDPVSGEARRRPPRAAADAGPRTPGPGQSPPGT